MQFLAIPVDIADAVLKRPGLSFFCAVLFFFLILGDEIQLVFFVKIGGNGRVIEGNIGKRRLFDGTGDDIPGAYAETAVWHVEDEMAVRVFPDQISELDVARDVWCQCFYGNRTAEHGLTGHGMIEQAGGAVDGCKSQSAEKDGKENEDNQRPLQCFFMTAASMFHCVEYVQLRRLMYWRSSDNCIIESIVLTSL